MLNVVLYEPEIPPNTGNIIRLCANTGARLHLIHPLGFEMDDRKLRRASLDYREWSTVQEHKDLGTFLKNIQPRRLLSFSTLGERSYHTVRYGADDALLFGPETRGLPQVVQQGIPAHHRLRIPMVRGGRSLNLSNAVAVAVYEAWRQHEFPDMR